MHDSVALIKDLGRIFPPDRLLDSSAQLAPYESDGLTCFRSRPCAVVLPETQEEVIQAVRWCYEHSVPFMARGSGTSLLFQDRQTAASFAWLVKNDR